MGRIYVTGASGRLGRELLRAMPGAIPLVRKAHGLDNEMVTDFSSSSLGGILKDASAIIHLAGSRDFLDIRKAREGNVELTRRIVEAAPKDSRVVFASSISVYGKRLAHIPADEGTEPRPDTAYAKTKLEAERVVEGHPKHAILRIGPIYGPGFGEYFSVLTMLEKGRMSIIGDGKNRIPFVHVLDVVDALKAASSGGNGTYVIVGPTLSQEEVFAIAADALGVRPPTGHTPRFLAMALARYQLLRQERFKKKARFIPEDIAVLSSDRAFDCSAAMRDLGFRPRPLEEGIIEMVGLYKKRFKT